jgi:hypothetical protein
MTKEDMLDKWRRFLATPDAFDTGDFQTLLTEDWSDTELDEILAPFAEAGEIAHRIRNVRHHISATGRTVPSAADDAALLSLAKADIAVRQALCEIAGDDELAGLLASLPVRRDDDRGRHEAILTGDAPHGWIVETVSDLMRARRADTRPAAYALVNAFFGLRGLFEIQWYCSQPLTDMPGPDLAPVFDFWSAGGGLAIGAEEILVRRIP